MRIALLYPVRSVKQTEGVKPDFIVEVQLLHFLGIVVESEMKVGGRKNIPVSTKSSSWYDVRHAVQVERV